MRTRTVKESLINRLVAQAEEVECQGLVKIAEHLTDQINSVNPRSEEASYIFASSDFQKEVESNLWNVVIAASDFYDSVFDSKETQILVEKYANDLIQDLRIRLFGLSSPVGAFEPSLPGEEKMTIAFEVEND